MTTVTLTHDKIREAAATSPEAKKALKVLAPEAFEPEYATFIMGCQQSTTPYIATLNYSDFAGKALLLDSAYRWEVLTSPTGLYRDAQILVGRKKEPR